MGRLDALDQRVPVLPSTAAVGRERAGVLGGGGGDRLPLRDQGVGGHRGGRQCGQPEHGRREHEEQEDGARRPAAREDRKSHATPPFDRNGLLPPPLGRNITAYFKA